MEIFIEYDYKNNTSIWIECMKIKVRLDVRKPLKRNKKITKKNGAEVKFIVSMRNWVTFALLEVSCRILNRTAGNFWARQVKPPIRSGEYGFELCHEGRHIR